jgi:hypothetical protein
MESNFIGHAPWALLIVPQAGSLWLPPDALSSLTLTCDRSIIPGFIH